MASTTQNTDELKEKFFKAIERSQTNVVKDILRDHPDAVLWTAPDPGSFSGVERTALIAAIDFRRFEIIEALLGAGTDANARNRNGETALMMAAGHPWIAAILLKHGADPNATDPFLATPLMHAAAVNDVMTVQALLGHHARINARDHKGWMALHYAIRKEKTPAIPVLLGSGIDVAAVTDAEQMARNSNYIETADLIAQHPAVVARRYAYAHLGETFGKGAGRPITAPEPAAFRKRPRGAAAWI